MHVFYARFRKSQEKGILITCPSSALITNFWLEDYRDQVYNGSTDLSYSIYLDATDDEIIPIENLVDYCMNFAKAIGFTEATVDEAFGRK